MLETRFGFILLENPFMRSEDIEKCLQIQGLGGLKKPIEQVLLEQGVIGENVLQQILAIHEHRRRRIEHEPDRLPLADSAELPSLDLLIERAAENGASDLLLSVGRKPMARFAGRVEAISQRLLSDEWIGEALSTIGGNKELADFLQSQCFLTSYRSKLSQRLCRVQLFAESLGASLSIRLLPHPIPSLDELGHDQLVRSIVDSDRGLVLVSGPNASGKTTTVSSILQRIGKQQPRHVLSLLTGQAPDVDLGEGLHTQRVIGRDCESLELGLHDAFREDVDVIVIDELQRNAPIPLLLQAATAQALVIATTRANSADDAIARLFDDFGDHAAAPTRAAFAAALQGGIYQELLPAIGRNGSVLASEVITPSAPIHAAIVDGDLERIPILVALEHGQSCRSFDESLLDLAEAGLIEQDEAFVRARDKQRFLSAASGS